MDYEKMMKLKGKETGERLDLKQTYKWILNEMSYEDFRKLARLEFVCRRVASPYLFDYKYETEEKNDSRKAREEYLKYLAYKLIQNLATEGIELQ